VQQNFCWHSEESSAKKFADTPCAVLKDAQLGEQEAEGFQSFPKIQAFPIS
jgi:hypothetical protein